MNNTDKLDDAYAEGFRQGFYNLAPIPRNNTDEERERAQGHEVGVADRRAFHSPGALEVHP